MNPVRRFRLLAAVLETPKLSAVMALMFVCLSIPILVFILLYNYRWRWTSAPSPASRSAPGPTGRASAS
jgi:hypothetical protein